MELQVESLRQIWLRFCHRINIKVSSNAFRLVLRSTSKKVVHIYYVVSKPLCFMCGKKGAKKKPSVRWISLILIKAYFNHQFNFMAWKKCTRYFWNTLYLILRTLLFYVFININLFLRRFNVRDTLSSVLFLLTESLLMTNEASSTFQIMTSHFALFPMKRAFATF